MSQSTSPDAAPVTTSPTAGESAAPALTFLTPTYNRAHTLPRVYASLTKQTSSDFEWVVVDDGSTDGTGELVKKWCAEATFPISYIRQDNAGKPSAVNAGVARAKGTLVAILDSDDEATPSAAKAFMPIWRAMSDSERDAHWCVTGLCADTKGVICGSRFPVDGASLTGADLNYRLTVDGEKWSAVRRDLMLANQYPTGPGLKFIPEGIVLDKLARSHLARCVNAVMRVYHVPEKGSDSNLSTSLRTAVENGRGMVMVDEQALNSDLRHFVAAPAKFLRMAIRIGRFGLHGDTLSPTIQRLRPAANVLVALALPLGALLYRRDLLRLQG